MCMESLFPGTAHHCTAQHHKPEESDLEVLISHLVAVR
jgi:hypothetical protein